MPLPNPSTQFDAVMVGHNSTGLNRDQTQTPTFAATLALDASLGTMIVVSLTGNVTSWSIANAQPGELITVVFVQDATGSRTLASAASNIKFLNTTYLGSTAGTAPTLTTTASKRDSFTFRYDGTNYVEQSRVMNM